MARQIDTRLARGIWWLRVRNVFVIAGSPDTWEQRAWVAYLATSSADGVLSHTTAAALYGLMPPSPLPHVTVPVAARARCRAAKIHRSAIPIADRQHRDGLTVTSPSRLLVDMAGALALPNLEELTDDVLCRKLATARPFSPAPGEPAVADMAAPCCAPCWRCGARASSRAAPPR